MAILASRLCRCSLYVSYGQWQASLLFQLSNLLWLYKILVFVLGDETLCFPFYLAELPVSPRDDGLLRPLATATSSHPFSLFRSLVYRHLVLQQHTHHYVYHTFSRTFFCKL